MAKLIYGAITSLDGYVQDASGNFDWAEPDEEVHAYVNDVERPIGTYLYGRRLYETMRYWETEGSGSEETAASRDYAQLWRAADKVVYTRTLSTVPTARTQIKSEFDPVDIRRLKEASERDISVGGATLAGQALRAGLVDECHLFLHPIIIGGGLRALPALADRAPVALELLDERRFRSGVVHLHYRVRN